MLKTIFNKRVFIFISVIGILFGFIVVCVNVIPGENLLLEDVFLHAREGRTKIEYGEFSYNPFNSFFNIVVFLAMITQFCVKDFDIAKSYVFARVNSVSRWYGFKLLQIFIYCLYSQIIYNLSLLLTVYAMGYRAGNVNTLVGYFMFGIAAGFLVLLPISVMCCTLSFKIKPYMATVAFMALVVLGIVAMYFVGNRFLFSLNVVTYYFTSFHIEKSPAYMTYPLDSWIYYVGLSVFSGVEAFIGSRILKKSDMI